ncbi:outer membrane protein assembly factor BamC [Aestuariirhabdus litorea]|uniref:Outer membrane protein assembly factor BamC n=1 Tax=Aestuariirhabdus litorea TaxID=2528527 RepID=A0A3P3VNB2_9GAMM|nr:outer membrane protein assembly factor BamC [Aestuariirhabdus litorea]RRJ84185.1 outer membrane protein assembly factor BamC [Aestuariirhabdus litorea]RWW97406.1 outer membrane protein assembly factor BamC [Endozoicomonadaceae bacterium GTF-13]
MRMLRMLAVLTATVLVSGCVNDYIRDRTNDYLSAELYPPTVLPEGYGGRNLGDSLMIPDRAQRPTIEEFVVPRPNAVVLAAGDENFRIEQDGDARWILARKTPSQVWPVLLQFWEASDVALEVNDPSNGELETSWVVINKERQRDQVRRLIRSVLGSDDSGQMQEKFRINVQQGVQPGSTEVHLLHARSASGEPAPQTHWGTDKGSDLMQSAMLNEMLVFISNNSSETESVSLVAQELDVGSRATLVEDGNGNPALRLELAFDRSWAAVGRALENTAIKVVDRDRSSGIYYLQIASGEPLTGEAGTSDEGFFSGWFGGSDKADEEAGIESYQLRLSRTGDQVKVSLERSVNELAPRQISSDLLSLIKDKLS